MPNKYHIGGGCGYIHPGKDTEQSGGQYHFPYFYDLSSPSLNMSREAISHRLSPSHYANMYGWTQTQSHPFHSGHGTVGQGMGKGLNYGAQHYALPMSGAGRIDESESVSFYDEFSDDDEDEDDDEDDDDEDDEDDDDEDDEDDDDDDEDQVGGVVSIDLDLSDLMEYEEQEPEREDEIFFASKLDEIYRTDLE